MNAKKLTMKSFLTTLLIFSAVLIALPKILSYFFTDKSMLASFIMLLMWYVATSQHVSDLSDKLKKVILIWFLSSIVLTISFVIGLVLNRYVSSLQNLLFLLLFGFLISLFYILMYLPTAIENFEKRKPSTGGYKRIFLARLCSFVILLLAALGMIGFFSYMLRAIILRGNIDDISGIFVPIYIAAALPLVFTVLYLFTVIRDYKKLKAAASLDKDPNSYQQPNNHPAAAETDKQD